MNISEIMELIEEDKLRELGALFRIDKINSKITGSFIVKSFVKCALIGRTMSLRALENICNNSKDLSSLLKSKDPDKQRIDHISLGKRLKTIDPIYFKEIYDDIVVKYNNKFTNSTIDKFRRFDSTIINLSSKLLKDGLKLGGSKSHRQIKMSFGLKNSIPSSIRFCTEQSDANENIALVKAINETKLEKEEILLFDRGISKADTFGDLVENKINFITRVNLNRKYITIKTNELTKSPDNEVTIFEDKIVNLYNRKNKKISYNLRLIKVKTADGKELWFLTNLLYLAAIDIAQSYKKRWEIEVFFKFLKQNLQFKKFISYNNNGMQVYLYCLLIAAILFTIYKIQNKLIGFKIPLLQFALAIEKAIIKDIVVFCGGNPTLVDLKL